MHIFAFPLDLYSFLQFLLTVFCIIFGLLYLVKNIASKYFFVDANFDEGEGRSMISGQDHRRSRENMLSFSEMDDSCASCGHSATKKCSRCKVVRYCTETCQSKHWRKEHKLQCEEFKRRNLNLTSTSDQKGRSFGRGDTSSNVLQLSKKVLFPYEEFVKLFTWDKQGIPPCGLLNCGNSCFANVVLQCLSCTRPLVAYLLEKGHRKECRRNDWCFLCELQAYVERAIQSSYPFSPINILSRLPNIGGNLGYGKQEDAHEFMRFAIDTMQSVCLDEFGGEKALHPSSMETTVIQYIFGGQLESQVTCTKCKKVSNRYENMMDLTVEIQGDAESLEDCLDQFTVKEWLDGENMYQCEGCNDYVKAWKRLTVRQAPNVLTIALKRFQSGRFGKLNKRVTFPETLDLGPYMSEARKGTDLYQLYAVVVHVDMLNASFFGHYICYTKDFDGNWYRIDDPKVTDVELEEVLGQGAYMLLYSRTCVRSSCTVPLKSSIEEDQQLPVEVMKEHESPNTSPGDSPAVPESVSLVEAPRNIDNDVIQQSEQSILKTDPTDMDLEGPFKVQLRPEDATTGQDVDMGNADSQDCDSEHTQEVLISSSNNGQLLIGPHLDANSDADCSFRDRNGENTDCNIELMQPESLQGDHLSCQNGSDEMVETPTVSITGSTSTTKNIEIEENSAGSFNTGSENLIEGTFGQESSSGRDIGVKISNSVNGNVCSKSRQKPLFSRGFLDKGTRYRSVNGKGKTKMVSGEVGPSYKVMNSNSNGFATSLLPPSSKKKTENLVGEDGKLNVVCNGDSSHTDGNRVI